MCYTNCGRAHQGWVSLEISTGMIRSTDTENGRSRRPPPSSIVVGIVGRDSDLIGGNLVSSPRTVNLWIGIAVALRHGLRRRNSPMSLEWARARALENAARRSGLAKPGGRTYSLEINFASPVVMTLSWSDAKSHQCDLMNYRGDRPAEQRSANDGSWSIVTPATPKVWRISADEASSLASDL